MFKRIIIFIVLLLAAFLILVAFQPSSFRIERTLSVSAPPAVVFEHVNNFHRWDAWSPWAKLDPAATNTFAGPDAGTGAVFAWDGNDKVGAGRMTIIDSRPAESVRIRIDFLRPMAATNIADFTFAPDGEQTKVTWAMSGHNGFLAKAFCLLADMDRILGAQFEQGLTSLKELSEKSPSAPAAP